MVAWAAPRSIAACRIAQMITPIAAAMITVATVTPKLREYSILPPTLCRVGSPKRRTATALMNESGTTTTATITISFAAFSL